MTFDDYKQAVKDDAIEAVNNGDYDYCEDFDAAFDDMWCDDSITGNGSGSYTFSTAKAKENTSSLIWDDEFTDECAGMCIDLAEMLKKGPEALDVTARCLALSYVRDDIEEAYEEHKKEDPQNLVWTIGVSRLVTDPVVKCAGINSLALDNPYTLEGYYPEIGDDLVFSECYPSVCAAYFAWIQITNDTPELRTWYGIEI